MIPILIAALALLPAPASDWCTTGWDCTLFCGADVDHDTFADIITVNGNNHLCAALNVSSWKAAPWIVLAEGLEPNPVGLAGADFLLDTPGDEILIAWPGHIQLFSAYRGGKFETNIHISAPPDTRLKSIQCALGAPYLIDETNSPWTLANNQLVRASMPIDAPAASLAPPPFESAAPVLLQFIADINGDKLPDPCAVFTASLPHQHRVVRVAITPNPQSPDQDSDGLSDEEEKTLGTHPHHRDTDDDGLLDGWEVHGLPRNVPGPETALNPLRQDFIVAVAPYEGTPVDKIRESIERSKSLYAAINHKNPDGSTGISMHFRFDPIVPRADHGHWHHCATKHFPASHRGLMHWMQVSGLGGGGQAQQLGDEGGSGANWAAFAHEVGHQLSLSHTGDSAPPWCPLYPSIMNYAFNYSLGGDGNAIRFSDGRFASVELREPALTEHLPFPIDLLRYLNAGPFHFTLEDDGAGGTRIDWNHNGRIDADPVAADVNYGSSTNGGDRRNHGKIGAGPALARLGDTLVMATLDQIQSRISLRTYLGDEKWSDPREVPSSATQFEPVLIGGQAHGHVLWRRHDGWRIARFSDSNAFDPIHLPGLPPIEVSGGLVNDRILLVGRRDDDSLATWWLEVTETEGKVAAALAPGPALDFPSQVAVDFTIDPATRQLIIAGSHKNPGGREQCLKVAWFEFGTDGSLKKIDDRFAGGEKAGWSCTTRPVIRCTPGGELYIFHTGWPDGDGQMTAWRTKRLVGSSLNDGWLLSMLYDIWTRTRRPVAFDLSPQGSVYAFRWDSGAAAYDNNDLLVGHNGLGIDEAPMRDYDDGSKIALWGIRHSILNMRREP